MQPSTALSQTLQPRRMGVSRLRPFQVRVTTRPLIPWERPRLTLRHAEDLAAPVPAAADHRRRAELSRQLAMMPPRLVHQLLTVELRETAPQHRHELLVRQLRETAPAHRRELLALHLRTLGPGLVRAGALADEQGHLPAGFFEDGSLDVLLAQLGVAHDDASTVAAPGVSPLCAGLGAGDGGRAVVALQARLLALGYLEQASFSASPGEFDVATASAVRAFQSDRLLPATGYYGVLTHLALYAEVQET